MGALLNPVGPESPATYWIRRGLVLGAVAVVVAGLVWLFTPRDVPVTAVPSVSPSVSATGSVSPSATPSPASSPGSASPSPSPTGPVACDPASTVLTVRGFSSVTVGSRQVFTLTLANSSAVSCVLEVNPATYDLTVTSGSDRIWSTADCAKWLPAKKLTLKPGATHEFQVTWGLHRTGPSCSVAKKGQGAGTYVAKATYRESASARFVFALVAK